jgi:hypothetical protein
MSFERGPPRTDLTILTRRFSTHIAVLENGLTLSDFRTRFRVDPTFGCISRCIGPSSAGACPLTDVRRRAGQ